MSCPSRYLSTVFLTFSLCAFSVLTRADKPGVREQNTRNKEQPQTVTYNRQSKIQNRQSKISSSLKGSDVMATVEGEPITRRDLTNLWIKIDNQANRPLGMILLERMRGAGGVLPSLSVTEADVYKALYSGPSSDYATYLSNLVTNRLVAREAKRKGVVVTQADAERAGHDLLQQVREQKNIKISDDQILTQFRVPRDIFLDEMTFRLRGERLLAKSIEARNGHALGADDWVSLRQLFAGANVGADAKKNAQEFAEAKTRVQTWAAEVKAGKPFGEVAKAHNEDETRGRGGNRGPNLRGTGTKDIEDAVFRLKSGEMSAPLRTKDGWYVFLIERRGVQIPASERAQAWKQVVEKRVTPLLVDLRKHAKITSVIPLPADTVTGQTGTPGGK